MFMLNFKIDNMLMIISTKNRLCCAALFVSLLPFALPQAQGETVGFIFGPPLTPVWDVTGTYNITNFMQSPTISPTFIVFKDIPLSADGSGKISGSGQIIVTIGDGAVGGNYKASGKISGGGSTTRVNLSIHFNGNGTVAGVLTACNISANYKLTVNPATQTLVGQASGSANFSHLGKGNLKAPVALPLPAGVDGGWTAVLDFIPFSNKLSGSGIITVDNSSVALDNSHVTVLATKLTGTAKSGVRKVKLSGSGFSSGTKLNLDYTPILDTTNQLARINGKVLGQTVKN
jgi:hypothetical protein